MYLKPLLALLPCAILHVLATPSSRATGSNLPQPNALVDLGYAQHIPTIIDTTPSGQRVAIYKNIRFANPPTGNLRFRRPSTRLPTVSGIQDGKGAPGFRECISSAPWYVPFPEINGTTWGHEDCLFLDVYVPASVKPGDDVPVLHFFYGSAYAFGSKEFLFSPMGLFDQMNMINEGKFIFVVNNYRNGVSGWSYSNKQDMDANVGLYDCLAAAEWTAKFIHKFGGSGKRITAMGQSAGAGILYYMTVLNGGKGKLPFQQVFLSSPAAPPRRNITQRQTKMFQLVLDAANCTSIDCLRSLPEASMLAISNNLINEMPTESGGGTLGPIMGFGPSPDGKSIPDLPLALLKRGHFHKELKRLVLGSMLFEGMGTSSDGDMPAKFPALVRRTLTTASNDTVAMIRSGYQNLSEPAQLAWDWTTDVVFACNAYNLAQALPDKSHRYIMSEAPAIHGQDLTYFFYSDPESTPVRDIRLAREFQTKLLRFIQGKEMGWPRYDKEQRIFNISETFRQVRLPVALAKRCETLAEMALDAVNGA